MSKCIYCGIPQKMHNSGVIEFQVKETGHRKLLTDYFTSINIPFFESKGLNITTEYHDFDHAKKILVQLHSQIGNGTVDTYVSFRKNDDDSLSKEFHPINYTIERISNKDIIDFITNGEIQSYLQPVINLKNNNQIFGYENLLRSKDPTTGMNPGTLFDVAHKTGLHSLLDKRARTEAIKTRAENILPNGIKSFINFLPSTIYNPKFCLQHTFNVVDHYNINPGDLVFEVVETEKIDDVSHLKSIFAEYKASGMQVALDDVGKGYATIDMLKKLQPDYVKIDRDYISFCDQNSSKQAFLLDVLSIANGLGITVLGEGIERLEELEYCKEIGMDLAQGYFIGKPAPAPYQLTT